MRPQIALFLLLIGYTTVDGQVGVGSGTAGNGQQIGAGGYGQNGGYMPPQSSGAYGNQYGGGVQAGAGVYAQPSGGYGQQYGGGIGASGGVSGPVPSGSVYGGRQYRSVGVGAGNAGGVGGVGAGGGQSHLPADGDVSRVAPLTAGTSIVGGGAHSSGGIGASGGNGVGASGGGIGAGDRKDGHQASGISAGGGGVGASGGSQSHGTGISAGGGGISAGSGHKDGHHASGISAGGGGISAGAGAQPHGSGGVGASGGSQVRSSDGRVGVGASRVRRYTTQFEPYRRVCTSIYDKLICYRLYDQDAEVPRHFTCWQTASNKKNCTETENVQYLESRHIIVDPAEVARLFYGGSPARHASLNVGELRAPHRREHHVEKHGYRVPLWRVSESLESLNTLA